MKQNGKEIGLKSTEKQLTKDEKYMHEVFLFFEKYVIVWEKPLKKFCCLKKEVVLNTVIL